MVKAVFRGRPETRRSKPFCLDPTYKVGCKGRKSLNRKLAILR
jgi:hypothetical protein